MADSLREENGSSTGTVLQELPPENSQPAMRLKLKKPKGDKKVAWTPDTVDNEHMNKKKSKCCCIYEKPKEFNESSSEDDDDECDHCKGHVEMKNKKSSPSNNNQTLFPNEQGDEAMES